MAEVIGVSALNRYVKQVLERDSVLDGLAIRGEITGFVHHYKSGHWYFSLRDEQCSVKTVMFSRDARSVPFLPENGMKVIVRGRVSLFERDGTFQLYAEDLIPDGVGAMQFALEQLKAKLKQEGMFDPEQKKTIPTEPYCIGIVTSATGAALQDVCNVLRRRWPMAKLLLAAATVQGETAEKEVSDAIARLDKDGRADVILVTRGGGSKEDLWVFNSERIARAAYNCKTPLISAVGHEIDTCILDLVADLRAPTPSAAAELCTPDIAQILKKIALLEENIEKSVQKRIDLWYTAYKKLSNRITEKNLNSEIQQKEKQMQDLMCRISNIAQMRLQTEQTRLQAAAGLCAGLNPYYMLAKGYAIVCNEQGIPIQPNTLILQGSKIAVERENDTLCCLVEQVRPKEGTANEKTKNL